LDEVGDMSAKTQAKVLRALQEGRFTRVGGSRPIESDARVLSATNKNLSDEIRRGAFREDLYFRLAVVPISVPPLRERTEDVPLLAAYFLREASVRFGRKPKSLSPAAIEALERYRWPGNVRELKNLMERLMILSPADEVRPEDLPVEMRESIGEGIAPGAPLREARDDFERRYILAALKRYRGNVSRTAEALDLERSNLYRKLKTYGIEVERE
ncbi:MAG TPA: sigma 54-interacting transcriptional regulator, partial [Thermoanaerobaculia bacterium]|nr:sigma 54-interacting transcriptional regulator [Thermoanaerobaculia bacterium]